jgi:hypothetical protein
VLLQGARGHSVAVRAKQPGEARTHRGTAQKVVIVSETRNGIKDTFQEAQRPGRDTTLPA